MGDSRCVVGRADGRGRYEAYDMSVDHKPEDEKEEARITNAGGRVTMDGRVNGGLNLSRALGGYRCLVVFFGCGLQCLLFHEYN